MEPLLADPPRRFRYPGRHRYPGRACLEGILYVLYTDTPWLEVPYRELGLPSGEYDKLMKDATTVTQVSLSRK